MKITDILIFIRFKYLLLHNLHNFVSGPSFFADHEFLSSMYLQAQEQYDSLIERIIGLEMEINPNDVQIKAAGMLEQIKFPYENIFELAETVERQLSDEINAFVKSARLSQGTVQLFGNFADQAEINLYKIRQRLKSL